MITITFDIPDELAERLTTAGLDIALEAKEAFLVELYRQGSITCHQLARALGLCRYETDGVLKKHGVDYGLTFEQFRADAESLHRLLAEKRPEKG
jgi:predicted HTH domain antitoxin